jgi:hypothetical protein
MRSNTHNSFTNKQVCGRSVTITNNQISNEHSSIRTICMWNARAHVDRVSSTVLNDNLYTTKIQSLGCVKHCVNDTVVGYVEGNQKLRSYNSTALVIETPITFGASGHRSDNYDVAIEQQRTKIRVLRDPSNVSNDTLYVVHVRTLLV